MAALCINLSVVDLHRKTSDTTLSHLPHKPFLFYVFWRERWQIQGWSPIGNLHPPLTIFGKVVNTVL